MGKRVVLHWYRTDLRLHDSPSLKKAIELADYLYPVWCWDPHYVYSQRVGPNRWQFLTDSMKDLSDNITKINPKSKLHVVRGPPTTVLPALFESWKVTDIVWERDDDPYTHARDATVQELAKQAGVNVHIVLGHTLYDSEVIKNKAEEKKGGKVPYSFGPFMKILEQLPEPDRPIDAPKSLPNPGPTDLKGWSRDKHSVDKWRQRDVNQESRNPSETERDQSYETFAGPNGDFAVPTMEELGMKATSTIRGGETRALERFEEFMKNEKEVANFQKPKTSPAAFDPPATTQLSPHMKFGTLSVRVFWWRVMDINAKHKGHSQPPESLIGQLLWREFYHAVQFATPNYNRIRGNPASRFIGWSLQTRYDDKGVELPPDEMVKVFEKEEPEAYERFLAWKEGRTGFPWIDALMRQLREEGWMHHLGRHSVACFLTRGQLYISWERGAEVFDHFLVDQNSAMNYGNWMWLSASQFFSQYFRVYSPATYGQKSDKHGALIRKYCPELDGFSDKHIYEPWKASAAEQKKVGCVLGKDYPERIVDDKAAKERCIELIKAAYKAHIYGDDERVLNGTADDVINALLDGDLGDSKEEVGKVKSSPVKRKKGAHDEEEDDDDGKKPKQTKLNFAKEE